MTVYLRARVKWKHYHPQISPAPSQHAIIPHSSLSAPPSSSACPYFWAHGHHSANTTSNATSNVKLAFADPFSSFISAAQGLAVGDSNRQGSPSDEETSLGARQRVLLEDAVGCQQSPHTPQHPIDLSLFHSLPPACLCTALQLHTHSEGGAGGAKQPNFLMIMMLPSNNQSGAGLFASSISCK